MLLLMLLHLGVLLNLESGDPPVSPFGSAVHDVDSWIQTGLLDPQTFQYESVQVEFYPSFYHF